ncbi:MAG: competence/damage-inducible protein A [Oscillospiraceae bacterium]|jgi:nicotinamide-nucleotide amidase|nr:competence/damage-inducible protein A [Oscillospiraceae bacterium]
MNVCEIISVGTELLLGEILNTNAPYLCGALAAMGISVQRVLTVGDNPARLQEDFLAALRRSDIVLLTGGLGPTKDDLTKETVCKALGVPLVEDPAQRRAIDAFFRRRGGECGYSNYKQALVPQGGVVLYNANGTAPGCVIRHGEKLVALLPGPPGELRPMFQQALKPLLQPYAGGAIVSHHVKTVGLGESRMAELTAHLQDSENPTVAPYAKEGESYLRVSAYAATAEAAEALCAPVIKNLQSLLGDYVYAIDQSLEETLLARLREQGKTIAFAESCTGGAICAALTALPGASEVFRQGYVTYANQAKQELLGVTPNTLARFGAVSEETAIEMAEGARAGAGADLAVAVTGVAGPGQSEAKPAGLIWLAACNGKRTVTRRLDTGRNDRTYNRTAAAKAALALGIAMAAEDGGLVPA